MLLHMDCRVIYSNQLEALYARLCEERSFHMQVVVPSKAIKNWIQRKMARDFGIAAGIDFLFLSDAPKMEVILKLQLLIAEKKIETKEPRILALAHHMAGLFWDYTLYGKPELSGWEEELWRAVSPDLILPPSLNGAHFFGFSHLPPTYLEGLQATLYVLSPCQLYWEDVCSESERNRLFRFFRDKGAKEAELVQLDALLRDVNPLLANWGRLGRRFFTEGEDAHVEPQEETQLGQVQRDLLNLTDTKPGPDDSIQLHATTSRLREVEELYRLVCESGYAPNEILVMAPDIDPYVPYIEAIFEKIPYQVQDVSNPDDGMELLLALSEGRFEATRLLALFRHLFPPTDVAEIAKWMKGARIRWGRDVAHQERLLSSIYGKEMLDRTGSVTWQRGFERLIDALTITGSIPFSQADLLEKMLETVQSLTRDLQALSRPHTPKEWAAILSDLSKRYFRESYSQRERLERIELEDSFSLSTIRSLLRENKSSALNAHRLDAVSFSSMLPMRAIPAKMVCLIGMDEGAFPRPWRPRPYDRLTGERPPSPGETDRYLFLEALLSARARFALFYQRINPTDGQPQGPSPLIVDLQNSLGLESIIHRSESVPKREPPPSFAVLRQEVTAPPTTIDLRDLRTTAVDPARFYLMNRYGIRFWQDEGIVDDEAFSLSALDLYRHERGERIDLPGGAFQPIAEEQIAESMETESLPIEVSSIVGEIPAVTDEGMVIFGRRSLTNILKAWPHYLAYASSGRPQRLIFSRGGKPFDFPIENPQEELQKYLSYHTLCHETLVPLLPDWIPSIVKGKPISKMPLFISPYLEWAIRDLPPNLEAFAPFQKEIESAFALPVERWKS